MASKSQITVSAGVSAGPKTKAKKSGKQGAGASAAGKKPGRGMGVAQLERMRAQESWKLINDFNPVHVPVQTGFGVPIRCSGGFLHGHPVSSFCGSADFDFNTFAFKKKRVINGDDFEGFARENKCYQGVEILAVHRKGVGTKNMVMEYGFFPANPPATASSSSSSSVSGYAANYPANSSIDLSLKL